MSNHNSSGKQPNPIRELHELFIEKLRKSLERASMFCGTIHTSYPRVFTDNLFFLFEGIYQHQESLVLYNIKNCLMC